MIVELVDARKKYGSLAALDGCDLKIESGELVAVLGLNGAGKTTMLKTMAGVSPLSSGHLIWDGRPCRREDLERRRRILFIPDTPFLVLERSVLENLALFLDAYEIERDAIFIAELLESFDLLEAATSPVSQLSRGQVYKTGLATLFAVEAEVPVEWECHCGEMALLVDAVKPEPKPVKHVRTHWDMLLERRTIADLEELLEERLAPLEADDDAGLRSA